ncbi:MULTISPECIES: rhodanese-like domain-containing protein [Thiomicrorhabdus]|uniref:Sulfurtransferase n=1 Tax=Thiomicrorhabdus heinhorstiae TaxID=2748010 RepID=A0ABS0BWP3_9GAMM|nr:MULTISPECIES: rhodanese-like domain-containing protein [Thiomicrorhabdus]MBF6058227.1 sulfurtransferase [Thiomicrorhabdus heinhorstiae]
MKMLNTRLILGLIMSAVAFGALASPEPKDPKKRTPQGLYVNAVEAYEMMKKDSKVLLVDVRTPEEWQFVGHTEMAQIMIPSVIFQYNGMDAKKPRYKSVNNSNFISELEERAANLGADEHSTYFLMCRSGSSRAQPAAKMMAQYGYKNVYIVTDGFEGGTVKSGDKKGFRIKDGWKNSGLPWTYHINEKKTYFYN